MWRNGESTKAVFTGYKGFSEHRNNYFVMRNWYLRLFGQNRPKAEKRMTSSSSRRASRNVQEKMPYNHRLSFRADEICHRVVQGDFDTSELHANICNFLDRDYSDIFKKCGSIGNASKTVCGDYSKQKECQDAKADIVRQISEPLTQKKVACSRTKSVHLDANQHSMMAMKSSTCCCEEGDNKCKHSKSDDDINYLIKSSNLYDSSSLNNYRSVPSNLSNYLCDYQNDFHNPAKSVSDTGIFKISLQYFPSVRQLRVSLFTAEELQVGNCKLFTEVALFGGITLKKRKYSSKKPYTSHNSVVFNECIYLNLKKDNFETFRLRVRVCKTQSRLKRPVPIGGIILPLDELNLDLDTTLNMRLSNPEQQREVRLRSCAVI